MSALMAEGWEDVCWAGFLPLLRNDTYEAAIPISIREEQRSPCLQCLHAERYLFWTALQVEG